MKWSSKPQNELGYLWDYSVVFQQKHYYTKSDDGSNTFSINEELSPNGITHGGYGYLDQNGDLIYIEYEKDQNGLV